MLIDKPFGTTHRQLAWLLLPLLVASSDCVAGQHKSPPANFRSNAVNDQEAHVAKGQIVTELDKAIWHVFQARNGGYWFGSADRGVYRYNGATLVNFTVADGLCDNRLGLGKIQEDKSGNIYFNTAKGISRFDGTSFVTLAVTKGHSAIGEWKLQPDDLWFQGAQDTSAVYRYDGKLLHHLEFPRTKDGDEHYRQMPRDKFPNARFSPYDVYSIFKDGTGNIWFGTSSLGACRFDGRSFAWLSEKVLRNGSFGTRSIVEDKQGRFWFCNTMNRYEVALSDSQGPKFLQVDGLRDINNPDRELFGGIMSSTVDGTGALWMCTYADGVWRYDGQRITHYPVKDGDKKITLFSIHEDRQGGFWLGTQDAGVYRFNGKTFEEFRP